MEERLIKISLLWMAQIFLVIISLGLLVNETMSIHIRMILFCGALALFDSVGYQKIMMSIQKNIKVIDKTLPSVLYGADYDKRTLMTEKKVVQ